MVAFSLENSEPLYMRAEGRSPGGPGEWNKVQKGQKSLHRQVVASPLPLKNLRYQISTTSNSMHAT
jgi:hypothetical protein